MAEETPCPRLAEPVTGLAVDGKRLPRGRLVLYQRTATATALLSATGTRADNHIGDHPT